MVKAGLLGFAGRRKSLGNVMEDVKPLPTPDAAPGAESPSGGAGGGGGFRLMSTSEAEARKTEEKRRAQEKSASKFRPFSSFTAANKGRNRSFDEDSPASSKRDSKSSSGTQSSRPYNNNGQFGSTSTLPSSADADANDNIFAIPRPHMSQHSSSPGGLSANAYKKQLPAVPSSEYDPYAEPTSPVAGFGRVRAMTSSSYASYASTAKPPTLDADMNFGSTSFDDLFSGIDRKPSPEHAAESPGRSLLAGKRTFHAEPIKIDRNLDVEPPLKSWDSRGSADNLMSSPRSPEDDSPPPPVPPHKHGQYAPVASHSPELNGNNNFIDNDASTVRSPVMSQKSQRESSPEHEPTSKSSSSAPSLETPLSSRSGSDITTPKATFRSAAFPVPEDENDDIFASPRSQQTAASKLIAPVPREETRPQPPTGESGRRVLTQAEFRAQQQKAMTQPQEDSSEEEEDYEDEEEAQERAAQEAIARRKKQQMDLARDHMRRTTTAPGSLNRPESVSEPFSMGFPSETSLQAEEWEDEDVPLGILAQHGFPSKNHNKAPSQPANATPSYFPDRPASAGPGDNRASTFRPVFARNLPDDPHAPFIGGGLVRPMNRESMGFNNRGPASIAGDSVGNMHMNMAPMGYSEPQLSQPSLVEQIHMRDMTKQKYMGGASNKKPQEGPFTGMLGAQMNPPIQTGPGTRMSMMPGMQGMGAGMNMGMGMGMNMMNPPMGMPMMGGQMAYPMQQNDMMQMQHFQQMQQMLAAQQMQIQQMQMQQADPRMSMAFPNNMSDPRMSMAFPNQQMLPPPHDPRMSMMAPSLNVPSAQRPMSIMPVSNQQSPQPPRPFSTPMSGFMAPPSQPVGYTPSIAPSERSNIGLSARYRPVATHSDAKSSSSMTMTLQAPGGVGQNSAMVKGILKNKSPVAQDDEDDGWGKMAARKSKYNVTGSVNGGADDSLQELVRGIQGL